MAFSVNGIIYHGVRLGMGSLYDSESNFSFDGFETPKAALARAGSYLNTEVIGRGYLFQKDGTINVEMQVLGSDGKPLNLRENVFTDLTEEDAEKSFPEKPTKLFLRVDDLFTRVKEGRI